jgi:formylglycine-generating enzyme required for sulfatase activity
VARYGFLAVLLVLLNAGTAGDVAFQRGDANADGALDISDPLFTLSYLFLQGDSPDCEDAADSNDDGTIDISDVVRLLHHLFAGESGLEAPWKICGQDPTGDSLDCVKFLPCNEPGEIPGFTPAGLNEQGYPEYIHDQTGIIFVRLPGGAFQMGSPEDQCWRYANEGPVHTVILTSFLLSKYEVSQAQWQAVMGSNPSGFRPGGAAEGRLQERSPELLEGGLWLSLPVETVSWEDIQEFEARTGLALPSEAQWEYACRAGKNTPYGVGDGLCIDSPQVNYDGRTPYCGSGCEPSGFFGMTRPVDSGAANGFGIHNMHGNLMEFCEDVFFYYFYSDPSATGPDPLCTDGSKGRVFRGGSWDVYAGDCRSAYRGGILPTYRAISFGFRLMAPLP